MTQHSETHRLSQAVGIERVGAGMTQRVVSRQQAGTIASLLVLLGAATAWAGTASVGGSAQPIPTVTNPVLNQQYDVTLALSNTSVRLFSRLRKQWLSRVLLRTYEESFSEISFKL